MRTAELRVKQFFKSVGKIVMHWVAGELISAVLILFGAPPLARVVVNLLRRRPDAASAWGC